MPTLQEMAKNPTPSFDRRKTLLFARLEEATVRGAPNECWPCGVKTFNFGIEGAVIKLRPHQVAWWQEEGQPCHELLEIARHDCTIKNCVNPYHMSLKPGKNARMDADGVVHPLSEEEIEARRVARLPKSRTMGIRCHHCEGTGWLLADGMK